MRDRNTGELLGCTTPELDAILGTALLDTGWLMNQAAFGEYEGIRNSESFPSRELAGHRIYPAIDFPEDGPRRDWSLDPLVRVGDS